MTNVCPKCGAVIVVETDDRKHAEKRIEKWKKDHKCKGGSHDRTGKIIRRSSAGVPPGGIE